MPIDLVCASFWDNVFSMCFLDTEKKVEWMWREQRRNYMQGNIDSNHREMLKFVYFFDFGMFWFSIIYWWLVVEHILRNVQLSIIELLSTAWSGFLPLLFLSYLYNYDECQHMSILFEQNIRPTKAGLSGITLWWLLNDLINIAAISCKWSITWLLNTILLLRELMNWC